MDDIDMLLWERRDDFPDVVEGLRDLVRDNVLTGWFSNNISNGEIRWIICPPRPAKTQAYTTEDIRMYIAMAADA